MFLRNSKTILVKRFGNVRSEIRQFSWNNPRGGDLNFDGYESQQRGRQPWKYGNEYGNQFGGESSMSQNFQSHEKFLRPTSNESMETYPNQRGQWGRQVSGGMNQQQNQNWGTERQQFRREGERFEGGSNMGGTIGQGNQYGQSVGSEFGRGSGNLGFSNESGGNRWTGNSQGGSWRSSDMNARSGGNYGEHLDQARGTERFNANSQGRSYRQEGFTHYDVPTQNQNRWRDQQNWESRDSQQNQNRWNDQQNWEARDSNWQRNKDESSDKWNSNRSSNVGSGGSMRGVAASNQNYRTNYPPKGSQMSGSGSSESSHYYSNEKDSINKVLGMGQASSMIGSNNPDPPKYGRSVEWNEKTNDYSHPQMGASANPVGNYGNETYRWTTRHRNESDLMNLRGMRPFDSDPASKMEANFVGSKNDFTKSFDYDPTQSSHGGESNEYWGVMSRGFPDNSRSNISRTGTSSSD